PGPSPLSATSLIRSINHLSVMTFQSFIRILGWVFLICLGICLTINRFATEPFVDSNATYLEVDSAICTADLIGGRIYLPITPFPFSHFISVPGLDGQHDTIKHWVYVDTAQIISATYQGDKQDAGTLWEQPLKAYPMFFYNRDHAPVEVETAHGLMLVHQEALDPNGKWRAIEQEIPVHCGNSIWPVDLDFSEFIVTKIPIYKGEFQTKLRVMTCWGPSNEYEGSVNLGQFVSEGED
ncbi:MAG: hypothetical protein AAFV07_11570, partial [Bacteroidota bacterium]